MYTEICQIFNYSKQFFQCITASSSTTIMNLDIQLPYFLITKASFR